MTETATATSQNLASAQAIYEAFGSGDIPAILERIAPDVQWEDWGDSFAQRAGVSYLRPRTGRDGAAEFFGIVGQFEITHFAVKDFLASGNQVAVEVEIEATSPGGGRFRDEELHLWTFTDQGLVSRLRHYVDTAKHIAASQGEDTTAG